MEESPNLSIRFGKNSAKKDSGLVRAEAVLKKAIEDSRVKSTTKDSPAIEEHELRHLDDHIAVLLGDSFRLSWSTVDQVRRLHYEGLLPDQPHLFNALCRKHLATQECPSPWQLLHHLEWLSLNDKRVSLEKFILSHFMEVVEDPDFVEISAFTLAQFLSSPQLMLEREVDAVHALLRWLNRDTLTKIQEVKHLLLFIHLERLSQEELCELDSVLRLLSVPLVASQTFQRRHTRLEFWTQKLGVHIYLSLNLNQRLELNELNIPLRSWETRSVLFRSSYHPETLTGTMQDLYVIGDEDNGIIFRNYSDKIDQFPLSPEFLGPVAYRYVSEKLYAVQNQGLKLKVWTREGGEWTCLASKTFPTCLYQIQIFANLGHLIIVGKRDSKRNRVLSCPRSEPTAPSLLEKKLHFTCTYHRYSRACNAVPQHPNRENEIENLGATSKAFWTVDTSSGRIWMLDLIKSAWHETKLYFPDGDHVLSSASFGNSLLVLSCNVIRGSYITLSLLSSEPDPQFGVIGSVPLEFQKRYINDFLSAARFHVFTETRTSF